MNLENTVNFLKSEKYATLATHSQKVTGYPFVSIISFSILHGGNFLTLLGHIAAHCKNIESCPKICLFMNDKKAIDFQNALRISFICDASAAKKTTIDKYSGDYFVKYPNHEEYFKNLNFKFFELSPVDISIVEGFGKAWSPKLNEWVAFFDEKI